MLNKLDIRHLIIHSRQVQNRYESGLIHVPTMCEMGVFSNERYMTDTWLTHGLQNFRTSID